MPDTERDRWINDYARRLVQDLAGRGITLPETAAREAVENMVTEVSDTAGISERDARLTITPAAVGAWATRVAQRLDAETEWVTISGNNFAAAQYWIRYAVALIESSAGDDAPAEQIGQANDAIARIGSLLMEYVRPDALEFAVPEEAMQKLVRVLDLLADWLVGTDAERIFGIIAADPPEFVELVDPLDRPWTETMSHHARIIGSAISNQHRHLADPDDVLTYDDVNPDI